MADDRQDSLTDDQLTRIVDQIVSVVRPATVVLFGSRARGDNRPDSDLDLLVIRERDFAEGESRRRELGSLYRAVAAATDLPKDILLYTRSEFRDWKDTTNHLASVAAREGRLLYGEF